MKSGFCLASEDIFVDRSTGTKAFMWIGDTEQLPVANAQDIRPRKPWEIRRPIGGTAGTALAGGWFEIDDDNKYLDVRAAGEGSDTTLTLSVGQYTGATLPAEVQSKLHAYVGGWTCSWSSSTGVFQASSNGGKDIDFRWQTGTHGSAGTGANAGKELGWRTFPLYSEGNTGDLSVITGEPRHWTHTWVHYRSTDGSMSAQAVLAQISTMPDAEGTARVDVSDVKILEASASGHTRAAWSAAAGSNQASFSALPSNDENPIRIATFGYSTGTRAMLNLTGSDWLFSWRHWDTMPYRHVNLIKAMPVILDSSTGERTVQQLTGHGLIDPGDSLGIDNYYPVASELRWKASLELGQWADSAYRTVLHEVVREGRHSAVLWGLRWDDIGEGKVDASEEADKGFLLWSSLTNYSYDNYSGSGSSYITGSIEIEQIR